MKLKNIQNRVNALEQRAAVSKTIAGMIDFTQGWLPEVQTATPEQIMALIADLEVNPINAENTSIIKLAKCSGMPPQECADVINQALSLQYGVLCWQKTHPCEVTS